MYTESNVKLSCNALWQKCVLATLYRAAATHPEIHTTLSLVYWNRQPGLTLNRMVLLNVILGVVTFNVR